MLLLAEEIKKLFIKNRYAYIVFALFAVNILILLNDAEIPDSLLGNSPGFSYQMFTDENSYLWQKLLSSGGINIYLFIITLSVAILLTVPEYRYGMNELLLVSKTGKRKLSYIKLFLGLTICCLSCVIILFSEPIIIFFKFGLTNGHLPLQTLPAYAQTIKNVTLSEALLLKIGFQTFGYCCLYLITMMLIAVYKGKSVGALTCVLAMLLVPLYLGDTLFNRHMLYKLPLPLSPILSHQYLVPSIVEYGTDLVIFKELSFIEILFTNSVILVIGLICSMIFIFMFSGRKLKK